MLWAIASTTPYQNHWDMTPGAISFTIPYQNHWNLTNDCYRPFPLQFFINSNEIWYMTAMGHFLYNSLSNDWNMSYGCYGSFPLHFLYISLSKSLKHDTWLLGANSFTIPYKNHWKMTLTAWGNCLYSSLSNDWNAHALRLLRFVVQFHTLAGLVLRSLKDLGQPHQKRQLY